MFSISIIWIEYLSEMYKIKGNFFQISYLRGTPANMISLVLNEKKRIIKFFETLF